MDLQDKKELMMRYRNIILAMAASAVLLSCAKEHAGGPAGVADTSGISFSLMPGGYDDAMPGGYGDVSEDGAGSGSRPERAGTAGGYDRVEFAVADAEGAVVRNLKGFYDGSTSTIHIEGLHEGEYSLLVLGVKGEYEKDGVTFRRISNVSDVWMTFPENPDRSLAAEYFHSSTPFRVRRVSTEEGDSFEADVKKGIVQKRIVGRLDFSYVFGNPYTESALESAAVLLESPEFYTGLSAGGDFSGKSSGADIVLDATDAREFLFFPAAGDGTVSGQTRLKTRDYRGIYAERSYAFSPLGISANRISRVEVDAVHPDDETGTMFITERHYLNGGHGTILSDSEHHSVYTDAAQRRFNTAEPLQISVSDGMLHVRFYSPKPLHDVLVKAVFPGTDGEYVDLAWFDRIPAFADFYEILPMARRTAFYRAESGRIVEIPAADASEISITGFKVESEDPYWSKLREIRHGWNITFSLYGGDPDREDGGPAGNWMGIRPVHCREAVALFLNFTYMIDMPEHEEILHENQDRLYGNGGPDDKVTPETVLAQMRQERSINVGLVYTGNGVLGLGGGNVFGAYQGGWLNHYTSEYACEVMFHELGHVMGYSHSSAFTYGPWAQELMNRFYVTHISSMPVESPDYLDSRNSPYLYASQPKVERGGPVRTELAGICGTE